MNCSEQDMGLLSSNRYGKQCVRVLRVRREGPAHRIKEITASVLLRGEFEKSYTSADNSQIVATDTVKNTVTALAREHLGDDIEAFALFLASHFLGRYAHVASVEVDLEEKAWERIATDGAPHAHSFVEGGGGIPLTRVRADHAGSTVVSGLRGLTVLKSTRSSFVGFPRCEFTTLPEAEDRIFSTSIAAEWTFSSLPVAYAPVNAAILDAMLGVFAREFSPSVQRTLFQMGEAALAVAPAISSIEIRLPNKHYLPVNLAPFGIPNNGDIFLPTDEPHGEIEAVITRD
jgi:urate oxidase